MAQKAVLVTGGAGYIGKSKYKYHLKQLSLIVLKPHRLTYRH
jgi:dTDP-D-glucose 4,6-dehydratase